MENSIKNEIHNLQNKIDTLEMLLHKVLINQEKIIIAQQKTNSHVDFVETVYDNVKKPFFTAMSMINYVSIPKLDYPKE